MSNTKGQQQANYAPEDKAISKTADNYQELIHKCPKCGAIHSSTDRFCSECGFGLKSKSCEQCGAAVEPDMELCPKCGANLLSEICSFCGANTSSQDLYCSECGNPRAGITCPKCNTLNFRSFCRKCNSPLNKLAQQAIALAKNDPLVKQSSLLIEELDEIERYILEESDNSKKLSEQEIQLINQHKELLNIFRKSKSDYVVKLREPKKEVTLNKSNLSFSINILSKEEAINKYREKLAEIQATLSLMLPDAGMTPQMQRDFYSARKVEIEVLTKKKVPIGWVCHAYGCVHSQPNECSKPFCGGKWIYEERDVIEKQWKHITK